MDTVKFIHSKTFVFIIIVLNTIMICLLTMWSLEDRRALQNMSSDIKELKRAVELEIKFREEIFPQIKKSAKVLSKYNPDLDQHTALALATKIYQCSDEYVPFDILTALIVVESNADHKAVSKKGALGLTQVVPHIWVQYSTDDLLNPYKNIEAGASILRWYSQRYGLMEGLRAYNSGVKGLTDPDASSLFAKKIIRLAQEHF